MISRGDKRGLKRSQSKIPKLALKVKSNLSIK